MTKKDFGTIAVYAPMRDTDVSISLYPEERFLEVTKCKSEKARQEKYLVWKLLEKVVKEYTKLDFANLRFTKTDNRQWVCPDFSFSLSHADGLVCVAISSHPVGVDAELYRSINEGLMERILTTKELSYIQELPQFERNRFLLEAWVRKESIFKKSGGEKLLPRSIEVSDHHTEIKYVEVEGRKYVIAVSSSYDDKIQFKYMEDI